MAFADLGQLQRNFPVALAVCLKLRFESLKFRSPASEGFFGVRHFLLEVAPALVKLGDTSLTRRDFPGGLFLKL